MENFRNDGNVDPVIEHLEAELDEHQAAGNFEAIMNSGKKEWE